MASYYMRVDGTAANKAAATGPRTVASACMNIATHNAQTFSADDIIYVCDDGGDYTTKLTTPSSGTDGHPITYEALGTPIMQNSASYGDAFSIAGSYIVVDGINFTNCQQSGVRTTTASSHNIIRNCEMYSCGWGILLQGDSNTATLNTIHDGTMIINDATPDNDYGANGVELNHGTNCEVSYNELYNCRAVSIDYGYDGGAVEIYGTCDGCEIHHNYAHDNNGFLEIGGTTGDTAADISVHHNISVNDLYGHFLMLHNSGTFATGITNLEADNNTIVQNDSSTMEVVKFTAEPAVGLMGSFANNIIYLPGDTKFSNYDFDRQYNLYFPLPTTFPGGLHTGEAVGDPVFVNAASDWHLTLGSPADDMGINLGYTIDYEGKAIPMGAGYDVGAYEYGSAAPWVMIYG